MSSRKRVLAVLGALGFGVAGIAGTVQAAAVKCTSEECACERALEQNTVEALEDFLKQYPQDASREGSACAALAVPPSDQISTPDGAQEGDGTLLVQPDARPAGG